MPDQQALEALQKGSDSWIAWRNRKGAERPNLNYSDLSRADLSRYDLSNTDLRGATLYRADFSYTNLQDADLRSSNMWGANFFRTNLQGADLADSNLVAASILQSNLDDANLSGCHVYGVSVWDASLKGARQERLTIVPPEGSNVELDDLGVAQFIYLLLNNKTIRHVIDTITSKVVLILGRFSPERKEVLDAIRDELRKQDFLPVLFDFDKPSNRDITETVSTLAHMAKFVIADITDAKSIPQELMAIVPALPSVPVQPLLLASQREYGMFEHFKRFPWVLEPYLYENQDKLLAAIREKVIAPAEAKAKEQTGR